MNSVKIVNRNKNNRNNNNNNKSNHDTSASSKPYLQNSLIR